MQTFLFQSNLHITQQLYNANFVKCYILLVQLLQYCYCSNVQCYKSLPFTMFGTATNITYCCGLIWHCACLGVGFLCRTVVHNDILALSALRRCCWGCTRSNGRKKAPGRSERSRNVFLIPAMTPQRGSMTSCCWGYFLFISLGILKPLRMCFLSYTSETYTIWSHFTRRVGVQGQPFMVPSEQVGVQCLSQGHFDMVGSYPDNLA